MTGDSIKPIPQGCKVARGIRRAVPPPGEALATATSPTVVAYITDTTSRDCCPRMGQETSGQASSGVLTEIYERPSYTPPTQCKLSAHPQVKPKLLWAPGSRCHVRVLHPMTVGRPHCILPKLVDSALPSACLVAKEKWVQLGSKCCQIRSKTVYHDAE